MGILLLLHNVIMTNFENSSIFYIVCYKQYREMLQISQINETIRKLIYVIFLIFEIGSYYKAIKHQISSFIISVLTILIILKEDNLEMSTKPIEQKVSIGEYKLSNIIGQGTFGKVFLGVHLPTGEKVAIKILQKQKIVDQSDIERVTREICILKILRHPNVVQLYEIIETKDSIYLIMEYASGGELFDFIVKKKKLNEKEAVKFLQQLVSAVEYLHRNGIVHRDLKPQNLLLDANNNIKVVDFGLSNQYAPGQKLKTACGSPCYAAPQMIAGKSYECLGVDVWSCGIILFAMLCGYLPFQDDNTNKLYKKILSGSVDFPRHLSEGSRSIIKKILTVDPQKRITIGQLRETIWYNQTGEKYNVSGIIIGKDTIDYDQQIVGKMKQLGYDVLKLVSNLQQNKHNYLTTFYYLLKIKTQKGQANLQYKSKKQEHRQRSISEVDKNIEEKTKFFIPIKKFNNINGQISSRRDESLNATKIISSLVEANKGKMITSPRNNLKNIQVDKQNIKRQPFKHFPDKFPMSHTRTATSQDHQDVSTPRQHTSRSKYNTQIRPINGFSYSQVRSPRGPRSPSPQVNKNREQMRLRMRQIPGKINQLITLQQNKRPIGEKTPKSDFKALLMKTQPIQMRKQNPSSQKRVFQHRDPFKKVKPQHQNYQTQSDTKKIHPYIHTGPFNINCLFQDNPANILLKILFYLRSQGATWKQSHHFTISISDIQEISIESLEGIHGFYLVKFSKNSDLSQRVIDFLRK